jgi:predicted lipoprotein with Yx(FWY)xxD motif
MSPGRLRPVLGAFAAFAALGISVAAFAAASTATLKLSTVSATGLGKRVASSPQGRTLYELSGETSRHLLCRSPGCLRLWPALTVASHSTKLKLGAGLHGRLALLRRSGGALQVTLNGHPLYRYSSDRARGQANGEGIVSFGGTWHAVAAAPPATGTPAPPPPAYTYPAPGTGATTTPTPEPPATTPTTTPTTPAPPPYPPHGY